MKAWGLVTMLVLWFGGIGGGFLAVGHEPRVANFLTAANAPSGGNTTEVAGAATAGASGSSILIKMKDFSFDPNKITAPAGAITLHLQNWGRYTHDFRIHVPTGTQESGRVGAGFAHDLTLTLKPGTYDFECAVSNHAKRGMRGTLTVTG
jgi:Copper binding proteins, plastocyanin/azurin family.